VDLLGRARGKLSDWVDLKKHVTHKRTIDDLSSPGDYTLVAGGTKVIMNCPVCNVMFVCSHKVLSKEPLTLEPSVVGPDAGYEAASQVLTPCHHHFWVRDGMVIDAM
jgi:hypothetical protein